LTARLDERPAKTQVGVISAAAGAGCVVLEVDFKVRVFRCMSIPLKVNAALPLQCLMLKIQTQVSARNRVIKPPPTVLGRAAFMFWFRVSGQILGKSFYGL